MSKTASVSVVIPTRNRPDVLAGLLTCLEKQKYPLLEVIIVDAGDLPFDPGEIRALAPSLNVRTIRTKPHLCRQRNLGIQAAAGEYVFLCDDDIRVEPDYVGSIVSAMQASASYAGTGLLLEERTPGKYEHGSGPLSLFSLIVRWVFQLGVWQDLRNLEDQFPRSILAPWLARHYRRKGNTMTAAGWPLVTQIDTPQFRTKFYGLGAAIISRDWLLQSPFDERLEGPGIGDNYGVALGFPQKYPIIVRTDQPVHHLRVGTNRLPPHEVYYRRVLALDYFISSAKPPRAAQKLFLLWSLLGHYLALLPMQETDMRRATARAFLDILLGRNPLSSRQ